MDEELTWSGVWRLLGHVRVSSSSTQTTPRSQGLLTKVGGVSCARTQMYTDATSCNASTNGMEPRRWEHVSPGPKPALPQAHPLPGSSAASRAAVGRRLYAPPSSKCSPLCFLCSLANVSPCLSPPVPTNAHTGRLRLSPSRRVRCDPGRVMEASYLWTCFRMRCNT